MTNEYDFDVTGKAADERGRVLKVNGEEIAVSEAVYRAYWQQREHEKYLQKRAAARELSWQGLEEIGMPVEAHVAERAEDEERYAALHEAMATLEPEMQEALWALVCGETTEQALACAWGISQPAVYKRKTKALKALRALLEGGGVTR